MRTHRLLPFAPIPARHDAGRAVCRSDDIAMQVRRYRMLTTAIRRVNGIDADSARSMTARSVRLTSFSGRAPVGTNTTPATTPRAADATKLSSRSARMMQGRVMSWAGRFRCKGCRLTRQREIWQSALSARLQQRHRSAREIRAVAEILMASRSCAGSDHLCTTAVSEARRAARCSIYRDVR